MRIHLLITLALVASAGCQMPAPTGPVSTRPKLTRTTQPAARASEKPAPIASPAFDEPTRVIRLDQAELVGKVQLIGKVKLLSDKGLGIISNNTGGLLSDKGGSLVSDKGLGYRVRATAVPEENLLADAEIHVIDAEGQVLVTPDGKPVSATTDQEGSYTLNATLPRENLILRIRLFPNENAGGQLLALLPKGGEAARTLDIGTASSLGASYLLDRYVKKSQQVLNKLPASEAEALSQELEAARGLLANQALSYKPEDLAAAVEALREKDPTVDTRLERIKAILLAGQADLGNGLKATSVSLAAPVAITGDALGNLFICESLFGRIRKVHADGTITLFSNAQGQPLTFGLVHGMAMGPDGSLYVAAFRKNTVHRIKPDGTTTLVAGNGTKAVGQVGIQATQASLDSPSSVAVGKDGVVYIGEGADSGEGRLLKVGADGLLQKIDYPSAYQGSTRFYGLAIGPDGTLWTLDKSNDTVAHLTAGGDWEFPLTERNLHNRSRIHVGPDGTLYVTESDLHHVLKLPPGGTPTVIAGTTGTAGFTGDGGAATSARVSDPSGMYMAPDGTFYFADTGNGLVRAIDQSGVIRTVAGAQGATQVGNALAIAVNSPAGLAIDAAGRLLVAETGSSLIKRLDGNQMTVMAGTTRGFAGDGNQAATARFDTPLGLAFHDGALYVLDSGNLVLRKIGADGVIETVAGAPESGGGPSGPYPGRLFPASDPMMRVPTGLAIDPQGRPVWSDTDNNVILRLNTDGQAEVIVGDLNKTNGYSGDGGLATDALLQKPVGVAYDQAGNLYIADAGNLVVRKVDPSGMISTFAGLTGQEGRLKLFSGAQDADGIDAKAALIVGPSFMTFDPEGNLYVAEFGTTNLDALGLAGAIPAGITLPQTYAKIRKITPDGKIYTVAGPGSQVLNDPTSDNHLGTPAGLVIDGQGRLIIADGGFNQIKMLPKGTF